MKEIRNILHAFSRAQKEGKKVALATVVQVEGSGSRHAGTRMLVTEDGRISGIHGFLEGNALRKTLSAMMQQRNKLVTYNTADKDDARFGRQLGCSGVIRVLFEPIQPYKLYNPIELLRQVAEGKQDAVLVSLFSLEHDCHPGTSLLYRPDLLQSTLPLAFQADVIRDAQDALQGKVSSLKQYNCAAGRCNGLVEFIPRQVVTLVTGRSHDIHPMIGAASVLHSVSPV